MNCLKLKKGEWRGVENIVLDVGIVFWLNIKIDIIAGNVK